MKDYLDCGAWEKNNHPDIVPMLIQTHALSWLQIKPFSRYRSLAGKMSQKKQGDSRHL
jgi:hypothetical protein